MPYLIRTGVIGARQVGSALATLMALPVRGYHRSVRANKRYFRGVTVEDAVRHMSEFVERVLTTRLCPTVIARLDALRERGYLTCLLTGAPEPVARAVVGCLGMADGLGTELASEDGWLTGLIKGPHYFGPAKCSGVADLVARHDIDLANSFAFADHAADVAFLECFGHPVAVRAQRPLRREARSRGWELLDP